MFTARWLHELSVGWFTPLDQTYPTLAEYLGERGYATAGFIANTGYCAADSGLDRGFNRYEDYIFPELTALKTGVLFNRGLERLRAIVYYAEDWLNSAGLLRMAGAWCGRWTAIARTPRRSIASFSTGSRRVGRRTALFSRS